MRRTPSRNSEACWLVEPGRSELRKHELPTLAPGYAQVRTRYSAISRGTESLVFAGKVPPSEYERMRAPFQEGDFPGPVKYGYINVGVVEEGPGELCGREVFCLYPHQTRYQVPVAALTLVPQGLPAARAVLAAGMETALNALWDAEIKIGDRVVVVGAGVIGSLVAYLASRMPGTQVVVVDVNPQRAELALALGADFATPDQSLPNADLVVHASGHQEGLANALARAGQESRIVELSWYGDTEVTVPLGREFHAKRLRIQSSQVGHIPPSQAARWGYGRRLACALDLLCDATLDVLISGESSFVDLPQTLPAVFAPESGTLCHRVRYPEP